MSPPVAILMGLHVLAAAAVDQPNASQGPPEIVDLPAMRVAGIAVFGHPSDGTFAGAWAFLDDVIRASPGLKSETFAYGIELYPPTWPKMQNWSYVIGCEIEDAAKVPLHLVQCTIPAGTYAVFRVKGGIGGIPAAYRHAYETWLPGSAYELAHPLDFERHYLDDDLPAGAEHVVDIVLPVKKKGP